MSFIALLLYFFCTIIRPQDWVSFLLEKPLVNNLFYATMGFLILEKMTNRKLDYAKVPQNFLMVGLFGAILMSHVAHTYFEGLINAWNYFLTIFLLFYLILNTVNSEIKLKIVMWVIVFLTLILVPQGMYQLEHGYGWAGQVITYDPARDERRINWIGIFNDPNDLGILFVVAAGIVITFIFAKRILIFARIFNAGLLYILLYGVFLTNSRGGLIAIMVTIYFFFVRLTRKFILGGVIGGALAMAVLSIGPSRAKIINVSEASAYNRIELWYNGILMMKSNPIFGVGFNMFTDQLAFTAHNSFVLAGAELGFLGLYFWMALIYSSYKCLSIVQENDPALKNYAIGLQSALIGFCAAAFFLSRTYNILPYILFALSGSMACLTKQKKPELDLSFTKKDFLNCFYLSVGILILIYVFIKVGI